MNTKLATSQIRLKNWAAIIQDHKQSGLSVNDYCPPACAPAKGQKNSQVSHFNQKPSYVKGRLTAALIVNILCSLENLQCAYS